jgi:hypothetical protein
MSQLPDDERCDALISYTLHDWHGQPGRPRKPFDLHVLLRCKRPRDHTGGHRSQRDVRQWHDDWTVGWIDDAVDD